MLRRDMLQRILGDSIVPRDLSLYNEAFIHKSAQKIYNMSWLQGTYRWYYGSNRSDVVEYLQALVKKVERHAELFSEPVTDKTRVLRENLKKYTVSSLEGLGHLQNTYASDNHMVAQIGLITEKLSECSKKIKTE